MAIFFLWQLIRSKMAKSAKESIRQKASQSEIYRKMQAVFKEIDNCPDVSISLIILLPLLN